MFAGEGWMIVLEIARRIPLPGSWVRACRRWKTTKIFSAYSGAMPIPLSLALNNHCWPASSACTEIAGDWRRPRQSHSHRKKNKLFLKPRTGSMDVLVLRRRKQLLGDMLRLGQ